MMETSANSRAVRSTYIAFIGAGLLMATWASRIPGVKIALGLDSGTWGLILLAIAAGSVSALPTAGPLIDRLGATPSVRIGSALSTLSLMGAGFGYLIGPIPVVISLFLMGFGLGVWDVSMNVHGSQVERRIHRSIMSRFHAGYSVGTVGAALLGAVMIALGVPIWAHFALVAVLIGVVVLYSAAHFFPPEAPAQPKQKAKAKQKAEQKTKAKKRPAQGVGEKSATQGAAERPKTRGTEPLAAGEESLVADPFADPADAVSTDVFGGVKKKTMLEVWREPKTIAVGIFVLVFALAEGSAIDWIGLAMIEDHGAEAAYGTLGLAIFLATMTVARWFGSDMLDRFGRVAVLRTLAAVTLVGLLGFIFAPTAELAFVGAAIWGAGVALGFPVGMSAGGDEPVNAALRVSVVASIGYVAFLGGPPLIGLLAQHSNILYALLAVVALIPVGFLLAGFLREPDVNVKALVEGESDQ